MRLRALKYSIMEAERGLRNTMSVACTSRPEIHRTPEPGEKSLHTGTFQQLQDSSGMPPDTDEEMRVNVDVILSKSIVKFVLKNIRVSA
jgi:hypothetical protein